MKKILFVCHGNVGRSQMAEAFYNHMSKTKAATSAGTDPTTPAKYHKLPDLIVELMKEEGISMEGHFVKLLTKEHIDKTTNIYILCKKSVCPSFLFVSNNITFWEVKDPYKMNRANTTQIKNQIKSLVKSIL